MEEIDYIDLGIAEIEQYCMIVPNTGGVRGWQAKGWKVYNEIGLPDEALDSPLYYGKIDEDEILLFSIPKFYDQFEEGDAIGRTVIDYTQTYGNAMGKSAGFMGFELDSGPLLVIGVKKATHFVTIDGTPAAQVGDEEKIRALISGAIIESIELIESEEDDEDELDDKLHVIFKKGQQRLDFCLHMVNQLPEGYGEAFDMGGITDYLYLAEKNAIVIC